MLTNVNSKTNVIIILTKTAFFFKTCSIHTLIFSQSLTTFKYMQSPDWSVLGHRVMKSYAKQLKISVNKYRRVNAVRLIFIIVCHPEHFTCTLNNKILQPTCHKPFWTWHSVYHLPISHLVAKRETYEEKVRIFRN